MATVNKRIKHNIDDVNKSIRKTNTFLRAANALRLSYRDINQTLKDPSLSNVMWTLIQLSRTYNALKRLNRMILFETNKAAALIDFVIPEAQLTTTMVGEVLEPLPPLRIRTEAFLDNLPIKLDNVDLMKLPAEHQTMIQAILEEEAQLTVEEARQILTSRLYHPDLSTGNLAGSIGWMNETDGVRIFADAYYAWWVELGHDNFPGHHYLTDAFERTKLRLEPKLREQLNLLITNGG